MAGSRVPRDRNRPKERQMKQLGKMAFALAAVALVCTAQAGSLK